MIIFFKNQPVTEQVKIQKMIDRAKELYGSDYYSLQTQYWVGDNITVDALFPSWIIREYNENKSNVLVIPIIKNYLRWLFSLEYGYGAQLDWEHIRTPLFVNSKFLEAYSDFYFPNSDFSTAPLSSILPNIRRFLTNAERDYNNQKGTPQAIKYLICNLLGFAWNEVDVFTANYSIMQVNVTSVNYANLQKYKSFLEEHVFPAGISIVYGVK